MIQFIARLGRSPETKKSTLVPRDLFSGIVQVENDMSKQRQELTQEYLKEYFNYDSITGDFIRKKITRGRGRLGVVGTLVGRGYYKICIGYRNYYIHRLIWLFVYGEFPQDEIDHINHNITDNRIANLRAVSHMENQQNMKLLVTNTSGMTGVHFVQSRNKWHARIEVDGEKISLGLFEDLDEAAAVRKQAEIKYGFHPFHGRSARGVSGWNGARPI